MSARPLRVGLFVAAGQAPAHPAMPSWPELVEYCKEAEAIGIDAIYLGDHLQVSFGPEATSDLWDAPTILAGIASVTKSLDIGLLMACTAFRNPALLARTALTIDAMSGGRMRLGLGAGWHDHEFNAFGYPTDHRAGRFSEAIEIIASLLRSGKTDFDGRWHQCREVDITPLLTDHCIPIIASGKGDRMLQLVARYADGWNRDFAPEGSIQDLPAWRARVDRACLAEGRDPATLARSAAVRIVSPGQVDPMPISEPLTGSPEQIADGLAAYAAAGYEEVDCWVMTSDRDGLRQFGNVLKLLDGTY